MFLKLFRIPPGELVHGGQGCTGFSEGCSMGGLDPNKLLSLFPAGPNPLKKHGSMRHRESQAHACA